jgi:hypothetical protein
VDPVADLLLPRQSDGERLLGQEGVIVVRIHACRYNNRCGPLL